MTRTKNAPGEITVPAINKFPDKLYRDVKALAAQKRIPFKELLIQTLRYALKTPNIVEGKPVVDLEDESGQSAIRRSSTTHVEGAAQKDSGNKGRKEKT